MIQLSIKECIVCEEGDAYSLQKLKSILNKCDIVLTEKKRSEFGVTDLAQDLGRLMDEEKGTSVVSRRMLYG